MRIWCSDLFRDRALYLRELPRPAIGGPGLFQGIAIVGRRMFWRRGEGPRGQGGLDEGADDGGREPGWWFAREFPMLGSGPLFCMLMCTTASSIRGLGGGSLRAARFDRSDVAPWGTRKWRKRSIVTTGASFPVGSVGVAVSVGRAFCDLCNGCKPNSVDTTDEERFISTRVKKRKKTNADREML